jgi:hypothetical protein
VRPRPASFGRTRTQTQAVVAKRTLSAISTCSASSLPEGDDLRPVLARLAALRSSIASSTPSGAERIAIARCLAELEIAGDTAGGDEHEQRAKPAHCYLLCDGHVVRQTPDRRRDEQAGGDGHPSLEERIDDLARAGALIAAEIDRLQQLAERRYA